MSADITAQQEFLEIMLAKLPPVIAREDVYNQLGGIVMPKTLINADSAGTGPAKAFRVGRKVTYETRSLLEWVVNSMGVADVKNITDLLAEHRPERFKKRQKSSSPVE